MKSEYQRILEKSGFIAQDGEEIEFAIEAELWASSSNPIDRAIGKFIKFLNLIVGIKLIGYLIVTNKRIVEISQKKVCWAFNAGKNVKFVMPKSVREVGYRAEGTFLGCFCQAYYLYYEAQTQSTSILLKGVDEAEAARISKVFYDLTLKCNA